MKFLHFFKAYCRLGLTNPPVHSDKLNTGVESAPDFIIDEHFLKQFLSYQISQYYFPDPKEIEKENYWQALADNLERFSNLINEKIRLDQSQVTIGGDNSVTFSSLIAIQNKMRDPSELGYIQFDSHGESNKVSTSPSGNFHGMYMRPFLSDDFEVSEINDLVKYKIPTKNVICFGNQELDGDEPDFFKEKKIRVINREEILKDIEKIKKELKEFVNRFEHIHINFDVDVMDKSITPATGIPTKNGFFPQDIFPLLEIIKSHASLSLDLVEVNPKKIGSSKTVKFAQYIIKFVYGN